MQKFFCTRFQLRPLMFMAWVCWLRLLAVERPNPSHPQRLHRRCRHGRNVIGATVWAESVSQGVASNVYGFYTLTLPAGVYEVRVSYLGYAPPEVRGGPHPIRCEAQSGFDRDGRARQLGGSGGDGERENRIEEQVQMSKMEIPIDQIKSLPAIGGEVDLLKSLQLLPGVQSGGEGTSGLYVRGGSPDQNLMLLDGVPLYSVNHLFGFFSVFNADAVKNMSITKGGFPARFGGRLSSILEINMKDGNMREFHGDGNISIIASKLTLEGPIVKDKASFMVSARRTYLDLLLNPIIAAATSEDPETAVDPAYYFYDLNGKLNWKGSPRDRVYVSAFSGFDDFGVTTSNSSSSKAPKSKRTCRSASIGKPNPSTSLEPRIGTSHVLQRVPDAQRLQLQHGRGLPRPIDFNHRHHHHAVCILVSVRHRGLRSQNRCGFCAQCPPFHPLWGEPTRTVFARGVAV